MFLLKQKNRKSLQTLTVPLYLDEERQRFITVLDVPFSTGTLDDWYRAGIALSLKDY